MSWIQNNLSSFEKWAKNVLANGNAESLPAIKLPMPASEDLMVETAHAVSNRDQTIDQIQMKLGLASHRNAINFAKRVQDNAIQHAERVQKNIDQHVVKENNLKRYLEKQQGYLIAATRRAEQAQAKCIQAREKFAAVSRQPLHHQEIENIVDYGQYNRKNLSAYYSKSSHDYTKHASNALSQIQNREIMLHDHERRSSTQIRLEVSKVAASELEQAHYHRQGALNDSLKVERDPEIQNRIKLQQEFEVIQSEVEKVKMQLHQYRGAGKEVQQQFIKSLEHQAEKKAAQMAAADIKLSESGKNIDFSAKTPIVAEGKHPHLEGLTKNAEIEHQYKAALTFNSAYELHQKAESALEHNYQEYMRVAGSLESLQVARQVLQDTQQKQLDSAPALKNESEQVNIIQDSKQSLTEQLMLEEAKPVPNDRVVNSEIKRDQNLTAQLMPTEPSLSADEATNSVLKRMNDRIKALDAFEYTPPGPWFDKALAELGETIDRIEQKLEAQRQQTMSQQMENSMSREMAMPR